MSLPEASDGVQSIRLPLGDRWQCSFLFAFPFLISVPAHAWVPLALAGSSKGIQGWADELGRAARDQMRGCHLLHSLLICPRFAPWAEL